MRIYYCFPFDNKGKLRKEAETNNKIQHTSSQATEVIPNQCQRLVTHAIWKAASSSHVSIHVKFMWCLYASALHLRCTFLPSLHVLIALSVAYLFCVA